MPFFTKRLKNIVADRTGMVLVFANLFLAVWGVAEKGGYGRFHFIWEPWQIKILTVINLPAITAAGLLESLVASPRGEPNGTVEITGLSLFFTVVFSTLQWLLTGFFCTSIFREKLK